MEYPNEQFLNEVKQMMDNYVEYLASMGYSASDDIDEQGKILTLKMDEEDE